MTIADIIVKILVILGMIVLMASPLLLEYATFALDRKRKVSHRRFRVLLFAAIYILAVTVVLALVKGIFSWIATWPLIRWILKHIAISDRSDYCVRVFAVMLLNFLIGMGFWLLSKLPRIGIGRKKKAEKEEDAEGEPSEREKSLEQRIVLFFHTDGWLRLIKKLLKNLGLILSAAYAVFFVIYQIPAFFGADWVPYQLISMFFHAANDYPILLLLGIWEMYFFLAGVEKLEEENEEWLEEEQEAPVLQQSRLEEIDQAVKKEYGAFYGCDVDLLKSKMGEVKPAEHDPMTNMIADSIRSDQRDPREPHEVYLNCMDALLENEQSTLIRGSFFSEFSAYFVRYLSVIAARGDNVVLVCNTEAQIESVCDCLRTGLSRMSSLYFEGDDSITMDEPIWNIASVKNVQDGEGIGQVDQCSFLVTTLSYLCSEEFEVSQHEFIHLIDTVVFIDTLKTVNTYHRQLSILNTRLKHITETNALKAQNSENFNVRYMSRPVRYICFDETRTPDLNEVLNNMLSADFRACDAMKYSRTPLVRCYNFEARKNEDGETVIKQPVGTIQRLDVLVNMALYCLDVGADSVTVFADGILPYARSFGICQEEQAQMRVNPDENTLRINRPHYSPKSYSVIIAMDSEDNLPTAIRRYVSMVSDEPTLIYVFSRPYMMRDYYMSHIDELWSVDLSTNIPVESNSARDVAQKVLARISSGGITAKSLIALCAGSKHFDELVKAGDVHGILREILAIYGKKEDRIGVYRYFQ